MTNAKVSNTIFPCIFTLYIGICITWLQFCSTWTTESFFASRISLFNKKQGNLNFHTLSEKKYQKMLVKQILHTISKYKNWAKKTNIQMVRECLANCCPIRYQVSKHESPNENYINANLCLWNSNSASIIWTCLQLPPQCH